MASFKVKFRPSSVAGHEGTIYYQIIHERKVRQLVSDYKVYPSEWDSDRAIVTVGRDSDRWLQVKTIRQRIKMDLWRLAKIEGRFDAEGMPYSADDIIDEFNHYTRAYSLFNFMEQIIGRLRAKGRIRTSETYCSALSSFRKFRDDEDVMLDSLTPELMEEYEAWLFRGGLVPNTVSFYTRILRAVYNRAVEADIIENKYPFRHVYTGVDKTVKRALPLSVMSKIKALDLSADPALDFARDMFLMSFYLRGMSLVDMAFLKKTDLRNGHVVYRRRKTGQQLIIGWTKEMRLILDKYSENISDYLLPIIRRPVTNELATYRNVGYSINRNLKRIADLVGVAMPLTLYVARHSWASAAKSKGIPLSVISEGMGHDSESTTLIYLASLDTSVIDRANSKILKSL